MSHPVHKSTYCLLKHGIPLFLKSCSISSLHDDSADPIVFLSDSYLDKVQATPFEVPQPAAPDDATSISWGIAIHEHEIRPVLLLM